MAGYQFSVFDISGRLVKDYTLEGANYSVDLTSYANGTYLYKVSDKLGKQVYENKFVVTK